MAAHWLTLQDQVQPAWWRPLEALADQLSTDPALPPIDVDDFLYSAWIDRGPGAPTIHVYRNLLSGRYLNIDDTGRAWRWAGRSKDNPDGYVLASSVSDAVLRADLVRAERLAARTHRGPRRAGWGAPAPAAATATATATLAPDATDDQADSGCDVIEAAEPLAS